MQAFLTVSLHVYGLFKISLETSTNNEEALNMSRSVDRWSAALPRADEKDRERFEVAIDLTQTPSEIPLGILDAANAKK